MLRLLSISKRGLESNEDNLWEEKVGKRRSLARKDGKLCESLQDQLVTHVLHHSLILGRNC